MAGIYSYDQFEQEARKSGLLDQFSTADLNLARQNPDAGMSLLKYKQDYKNAATDEARVLANQGAEEIRSNYGSYTGGADGGSFRLNPLSPSSFREPEAPAYQSRYDAQIQEGLSKLLNREEFSYNPEDDELYSQYKKAYTREGQRAAADAVGAVSAASGGIPSSYAATAASQAGNYYAAQMTDKIPELYDLAYNKYLNEYNMQLSDLNALSAAEQNDYSKYINELSQFNTDRNFRYNQLGDELNYRTARKQENRDNAVLAAQYGDYARLNEMGINTDNNPADIDRKYQNAVLAAQYGDYSKLNELGIHTDNNPSDRDWKYQEALVAAQYGDYSKLNELGINTENNPSDWERQYNLAVLGAQHGDYSGLRALGINPAQVVNTNSAQTRASGGTSRIGTAKAGGSQASAIGKNTNVDVDAIRASYPSGAVANRDEWDFLVGLYGEDALAQAGITNGNGQGKNGVTNRSGESWVHVDGYGRLSWQELQKLVDSGKITEIYDPATGKRTYKKKG